MLARLRGAGRAIATGVVLLVMSVVATGCGGSGASSGLYTGAGSTSTGGNLKVTVNAPAAAASARTAGRRADGVPQLRVHVQAQGVDVVAAQIVPAPTTPGSSVTVDFGWVPSTADTIVVEWLDARGQVVSTQTSSITWTGQSASSTLEVQIALQLPALAISPATATVGPLVGLSFTATGGSGTGYTWSLASNASGGTLNASTGAYVAGSKANTTDVVRITDSMGNSTTARVNVGPTVSIAPGTASLPPKGSVTFTATGGSGTGYKWTLSTNQSGGGIVEGTGVYTAGATGNKTDVVTVTDSVGSKATVQVNVGATVSISPASATVSPLEGKTFSASGGSGTGYKWTLSTNLSGGSIGEATGVYKAGTTGNVADVVHVVDSVGNTSTVTVNVGPVITITPSSKTLIATGTQTFSASGGSGTGFKWTLSTNESGGSIVEATGAYTAGPTGNKTDVVTVTDSLGNTANATVTVGVVVDMTTNDATGTGVAVTQARYMVNLAFYGGHSVNQGYTTSGLYDFASYGGNQTGSWCFNDGTQNNVSVTYGDGGPTPPPDFFGYKFKHPATVAVVEYWDYCFGDGGTFSSAPDLQYLDSQGAWNSVAATWNMPYVTSFAGGRVNHYILTLDSPVSSALGIRLHGMTSPAPAAWDSNGWSSVTELMVRGLPDFGASLDFATNLASTGTPVCSSGAWQSGTGAEIKDGNFDNNTNVWDVASPAGEKHVGLTWATPQADISAVGFAPTFFTTGGWFKDTVDAPLKVQYTTDGVTWTDVTNLRKGRYTSDYEAAAAVTATWTYKGSWLFTFDAIPEATGIRLLGVPGGSAVELGGNGYLSVRELQVFRSAQPRP